MGFKIAYKSIPNQTLNRLLVDSNATVIFDNLFSDMLLGLRNIKWLGKIDNYTFSQYDNIL